MTNAANELEPILHLLQYICAGVVETLGNYSNRKIGCRPPRDTAAAGRANETVFVSLLYSVPSQPKTLTGLLAFAAV